MNALNLNEATSSKKNNKKTGNKGEAIASLSLIKKGYQILERNYRLSKGEIDIIASYKGRIVFIEVKTRRQITRGMPSEAVNYQKRQRIIMTAKEYLRQKRKLDCPCRFDVIEIYATGDNWRLRHIESAFEIE